VGIFIFEAANNTGALTKPPVPIAISGTNSFILLRILRDVAKKVLIALILCLNA